MRSFKIRHIEISPALVLAPMSGVTCSAFRRLIKEFNSGSVGLLVSEFVSVEGLTRNSLRSADLLRFREAERPVSIQIFGYDPDRMRDAAMMVQDHGADIVDINCGCPAPKVVRRGGGCELMRQPTHLTKILSEVRRAITIPLTLKMRSGWDSGSCNALEIAKIAEQEGVEGLAVHGRSRVQLYRGDADWSVVRSVANSVKIPVCGSGDVIDTSSSALRFTPEIAGLLIGRGAIRNPLVFSEICAPPEQSITVPSLTNQDRLLRIFKRYSELLREDFRDSGCTGRFKQLISQAARGYEWRKELLTIHSFPAQLELLERLIERPPPLPQRGSHSSGAFEAKDPVVDEAAVV